MDSLDRLWELWEGERVDSPYAELMTYQSEINNGGHSQFFFNIENTGDLENEVAALETVLSGVLKTNLQAAYKAYMTLAKTEDEYDAAEAELEQYDDVFMKTKRKSTAY